MSWLKHKKRKSSKNATEAENVSGIRNLNFERAAISSTANQAGPPPIGSRPHTEVAEDIRAGEHVGRVQNLSSEPATKSPVASQAIPPHGSSWPLTEVARDLWKEAFVCLSQEDREVLRPAGRDGEPGDAISQPVAVEKILELTESKYEHYCRRGWHTKKGDRTKETNVRIKAKEIVCSALQLKDLVDAGLKFDPSGYGTIVWGVLSGVLTLVQNNKEKADAVFDSAAVLTRLLPKYAIIEDQYRDRSTQEQKAFEDQIEQVYVAILKYAACVQKELNRSVAGRLLDSFWTLENQEVKILKVDLEDKDKIVTDQAQFVAHQYRKREFEELDDKASETLTKICISVKKLLRAERLNTLKWLSDTPLADRQQELRSQVDKANKNSGRWLLESFEYTNWLTGIHSFVWLHGASGCGKSSLCSTVVKSLEESAENDSNMIVAYWYFNNDDSATQNLQRLLRFVLRRVSAKAEPLPEAVRDLANKHEFQGTSPSTTALMKALEETLDTLEENIYLVLDAIDEYQAENETLREEFLDFLVRLGGAQMRKLHLLVTSIADADVKSAFKRLQKSPTAIDVEKPIFQDVDVYVDITVKKYAEDKHWSPEIMSKISKALKDDGRFRIVSLQLEDLRKCYDDEIGDALEKIPHDIEDVYLRKLQNVALKDVRRLSHIFHWISVAVRQLTTIELAAAPGVNLPSPEELTNICPNGMVRLALQNLSEEVFIEFLRQEPQVSSGAAMNIPKLLTFDHPSAKRFLYSRKLQQSGDDRISPFFVSETTVNAELTSLMVENLLTIKHPRIEPSIFVKNPFLPYIAQHWLEHLKKCGSVPGEDQKLTGKLLTLFEEPMNPAYLNWIRVWNPESKKRDFELVQEGCPSPLYMAIFLGFENISKHLIDNRAYINATGGLMHTSLQLTSRLGYTEIAQKFIAAGADVDKTTNGRPTALYNAVKYENAEFVQMLLAAGAKPDADHTLANSALQLASSRGYVRIVESLVASNADVNLQSSRLGTALQAAAAGGHSEVVAILLKKGAKPDVVSGLLGTVIQAAATGGHSKVVEMLAAEDMAWDKKKDPIWHEAYDLWLSRSSRTARKIKHSFLSKQMIERSTVQQMLAGVLDTLSSQPAASDVRVFETGRKSGARNLDTLPIKTLILMEQVRRQGQEGMESEHYVYRALFWATLCRCTAILPEPKDFLFYNQIDNQHAIEDMLHRLTNIIISRAPDQKAIEQGNSHALVAVRHEQVECYVLAFFVVAELESNLFDTMFDHKFSRMRSDLEWQNERFESVMKIACLQEPSLQAAFLDPMHRQLLAQTQQEMRGTVQKFNTTMDQKLEEVGHRVVASIRDVLPGIIREEMRKLFIEQRESASLHDSA